MQKAILNWFDLFGRKHLPWQQPATPYRVWVSEIMLQQTQVATVIDYFNRFITQLPDIQALACASQDTVLHLWTGLGYYARARNLHKSANIICEEYNGVFPATLNELTGLPGIGRSTAGAILSIAMQTPTPILDGNVKRVLSRLHAVEGWAGKTDTANTLWALAEHYTPSQPEVIANYTQAIMDIGATLCTRTKPQCHRCPLSAECKAFKLKKTDIFPYKKPKKIVPTRKTVLVIIQDPLGQILLEKRPPVGLWGGLWSFPELDPSCSSRLSDIKHWCHQHYGLTPHKIKTAPCLRHSFSHFHLDITPVHVRIASMPPSASAAQVMEAKQHLWYHPGQRQSLGFAAPIKKLLLQYSE